MPERVPFHPDTPSPEHEARVEALQAAGGFQFEKDTAGPGGTIHFLGLKRGLGGREQETIIAFRSEIEHGEEAREIVESIQQTPLFRKMFTFIAESHNANRVPLIQSVPGTGKTFAYGKFSELLHGKGKRGEYLACTPRTSELDIIGHWAPARSEGPTKEEIGQKLSEDSDWQTFRQGFEKAVENLTAQASAVSHAEYAKHWQELHQQYVTKQQERVAALFGQQTRAWEFHKGPLLRAYADPRDAQDRGRFVLIDEIDNLPENYQNIFLQISGERAQLASQITTYADSGQVEYRRGPHTFVAFAANYPELAAGKRAVSAPLADRVDWLSITPEESLADERLRIEKFSFRDMVSYLERADAREAENLRAVLGRSLATIHVGFKRSLADWRAEGLEVEGRGRTREQEKEFSQRAVAGIEIQMMKNMENASYVDKETGRTNLGHLMIDAIERTYSSYLASEILRTRFERETLVQVIYGGKKTLREDGELVESTKPLAESPYLYVEDAGVFRPFRPDTDKFEHALAANEVMDKLVRRLSQTPEEQELLAQEEAEKQKHAAEAARFAAEDRLEAIVKNESLPQAVRERLQRQLDQLRQKGNKE